MKIAVAGAGYVGLSSAVLLAQHNEVRVLDIVSERIEQLNRRESPVRDGGLEAFLTADATGEKALELEATIDPGYAYARAEYVVIATPTDYDSEKNRFDTSSVEAAIATVRSVNATAWIVIKSTVPVGYTAKLRSETDDRRIIFSPEFLREGRALHDNLHPSRIVVGAPSDDGDAVEAAERFALLLVQGADASERNRANADGSSGVPVLVLGTAEAEAVKLFSNTYLALRVAYFNELDTYCVAGGLDASQVVRGVCLEPRIGSFYNNPSFGYGGYCLPKDTKQLLAAYGKVPQDLIGAIVRANQTRKDFIAKEILAQATATGKPRPLVGIYRLTMKSGSDNFRAASIGDVMRRLRAWGVSLLVYEPELGAADFLGSEVTHDLEGFESRCDVIVANRWSAELAGVAGKVYTRDLFGRD